MSQGQEVLAQKAASIGVELRYGRWLVWSTKERQAGLGDWYVNPASFRKV